MPNHVMNRLKITGPEEAIAGLSEALFSEGKEGLQVDFNGLIPRPEILENTTSGGFVEYCLHALGREDVLQSGPMSDFMMAMNSSRHPFDVPWIEAAGIKTTEELKTFMEQAHPDQMEAAYRSIQAFDETGSANWYDWSLKKWGTKWNAYNTEITSQNAEMIDVRFLTAWSVPDPFLKKLAEKFPEVSIEGVHLDEMGNFAMMTRSDQGSKYLIDAEIEINSRADMRRFEDKIYGREGQADLELSEIQKDILKTWSDGDFSHLSSEDSISREELDQLGDGLLKFVLIETSGKEGCEDRQEACRRLETAISQVENLYAEISDMPEASIQPEEDWSNIQKTVISNYGDFDHLLDDPEDIEDLGDGLLSYLLVELGPDEDCHDKETALKRLARSLEDLAKAQEALVEKPEIGMGL